MRKLLELTILTVAVTGFYTVNYPLVLNNSMSFFSLVNAAQKAGNIQRKYLANNQDNENIKSDVVRFYRRGLLSKP
ncbi:MAG: hypothetical protein F6K40_36450 [Okeania sp. SIO3I5]|uniref:hypothetical protein n=1 Tax=Okeania sp. SIO3I5 TaxID=2607805 RepID=UPI0013BE4021|nr:hypothetical protein [Okeania sp. SIO3I5]NEQ41392.1 hypothetical protein [Okeania sp. SIO3I5]